jgi:hypothetical protein
VAIAGVISVANKLPALSTAGCDDTTESAIYQGFLVKNSLLERG